MSNAIRWNIAVSAKTDQAVRMLLASQGGGRITTPAEFCRTYLE